MGEDAARRRDPGGHQKGVPVDRVKAQNVFTHHVKFGGPEGCKIVTFDLRIAEGGDVVGERVEPYIDDMARVARHRDAPAEAGTRDREVPEAALDEADHLVAPAA